MRNIILTLLFCTLSFTMKAQSTDIEKPNVAINTQNASVEKSTFGIQTGYYGLWVHNELKLSNAIALRTEIGIKNGVFIGNLLPAIWYFLAPDFTLEPRWYYNLSKRANKSLRTDGNSGNFLSLKTSYALERYLLGTERRLLVLNDFLIIPTWGIRRNLGKRFNYEVGLGIGYKYVSLHKYIYSSGKLREHHPGVNLHLRIGYRF